MKCYVISLPDATKRLERTQRELAETCPGLNWEIPEICDARQWNENDLMRVYDGERARKRYGRDLCSGEIGCLMSHLSAIKAFLTTSDRHAFIVEDDVLLSPVAGRFLNEYDKFDVSKRPSVVILSHAKRFFPWKTKRMGKEFLLVRPLAVYWACAYVVNRTGAELIIKLNAGKLGLQADDWLYYKKHGLDIKVVLPVLAGSFDLDRKESVLKDGRMKAYLEHVGKVRKTGLCRCLIRRFISFGRRMVEHMMFVDMSGENATNELVHKVHERKSFENT